jgi:hypothetical protein
MSQVEALPQFKLGKAPAEHRPTDFKFSAFAETIQLPKVPSRYGHGAAYPDWKVFGNNLYGDCVWAGAAHEHMLINKIVHGKDVLFDDKCVLGDYSAVTGFNASDPSTDNGTVVREALAYRRKVGIVDSKGVRHKIGAYVALDPKNWQHLQEATYIFGSVGIGFEFPASAMDQFHKKQPWDVVSGSKIEGGHYVPIVGSVHSADQATALTWGRRQPFTRAFYERYNDEAWVYITEEALDSKGKGLHGFDIQKLNTYLAALRD